ncbi:Alpha/Beta hydrolase protein [Gigaspora rosea]|uniref:Alpha/Beta hydrolase protein n=1 Tax=Gigaspora rosea TaxID=44941 RepID=A0A397VCF0_9GLOM|nr:Alpha/Beta hydrolase protein [Gigaspora rosea]
MALDPKDLAELTPMFISTVYKHFRNEIPDSNWDLRLHLAVAMLRSVLQRSKHKTIEKQQKFLAKAHIPSSPSTLVKKAIVPETCRSQAEDIMAGLLSGQEEKVGWRWKDDPMKQTPLRGEWVESKTRKKLTDVDRVILYIHGGAYIIGSAAQERFLIQKVAKEGAARAFGFDYRLAPQSPFPAALIDTLAAYLYLIQPPSDSGFEPINPKNIVIMGDSAGGGLALSLLLVLRDVGLPQPVGATCWSPWVDLFHSLPSIFTNASTDYLPSGLIYKASPANPIKDNTDIKQRLSRIQYYAHNSALDIPYVSPILADDLGGLGEIFITCGNCERLRDESILFANKAAKTYPELFNIPRKEGQRSYPPTKVSLNIFEAMPHVFQLFLFHPIAINAIKRTGKWIRKVIPEPDNGDSKSESSNDTHHILYTYHDAKPKVREELLIPDTPDDNEDDEFAIFTTKYIDIKGGCRTNDAVNEETLKEWINMLGKLPDLSKHPELLET